MTFATGLRSMMRADPDIVMVGEIRDAESAHIAVEAALTGHLVLSTLHAQTAAAAIQRLLDINVDAGIISTSINCFVAQRLARRLCQDCAEPYQATQEELATIGVPPEYGELQLFRAVGCPECGGSGYRGRVGLFEVMKVTSEMHQLIVERASVEQLAQLATEQGMRRLREDGMDKVRAGLTSMAEVARVVGSA
jgi:type IV pilus assembly protein PilB